MRPTSSPLRRPSRSRAIAARADTPHPAAVVATLGLIAALVLTWLGLH